MTMAGCVIFPMKGSAMIVRKTITLLSAAALFAASGAGASAGAFLKTRPVVVTQSNFAPRLPGDCPTCYKGHDFGSDCFQYVWTGFQQVWTNVCIWGWR